MRKLLQKKKSVIKSVYTMMMVCWVSVMAYAIPFTGGELNYTYIKNGVFEFTLILERDCGRFSPNPEFTDVVSIGVFDMENQLISECGENGRIPLTLSQKYYKTNNLDAACIDVEEVECREVAVYKGRTTIPLSSKGHQFVYSSCCRADNIENILDPSNKGFTLISTMTLNGYLWLSSLPSFNKLSPLYSCIDEEETYDPGIIAKDDYRYSFTLCTPYDGKAAANEFIRPGNPPYDFVDFASGYNSSMPLGENGYVKVDENTGVITYKNDAVGSYTVAVCVTQYKGGKLMGSAIKEIQLNFTDCGNKSFSADFDYTVDFCNPGRVLFENRSFGANSLKWKFYTDDNNFSTSTNLNPVMTFSQNGMYMVELAVANDENCVDTIRKIIDVYSFEDDIEVNNYGTCNSLLQSLTLNKEVRNYDLTWAILGSNGSETVIGEGSEIMHTFDSEGSYVIKVTAQSPTCTVSALDTIDVRSGLTLLMDTIDLCAQDMIMLNPNFNPDYTYTWDENQIMQNAQTANPLVSITQSTLFKVVIQDNNDNTCLGEGFVLVRLDEKNIADFKATNDDVCSVDNLSYTFAPVEDDLVDIRWVFQINGQNIESTEVSPQITFPTTGYYLVSLFAENSDGCVAIFSQLVPILSGSSDLSFSVFGNCNDLNQQLAIDDPVSGQSFEWYLVSGDTETLIGTGSAINYTFPQADTYTIKVISNAVQGCTLTTTQEVDIFMGIAPLQSEIDICQIGNLYLNPNYSDNYIYTWDSDLIEDKNNPNPLVSITEPTVFSVKIADKNNPNCTTTGSVKVTIGEREFSDFDYEIVDLCSEVLNVRLFTEEGSVNGQWSVEIGDQVLTSSDDEFLVTFPTSGYYRVTYTSQSGDGCTGSFSRLIEVFKVQSDYSIQNFGNCTDFVQTLQLDHDIADFTAQWSLINGDNVTNIGQGSSIDYDFGQAGTYQVQVVLTNDQCSYTIQQALVVSQGIEALTDTIDICVTGNVYLNPMFSNRYNYTWDSDLIADAHEANPLVAVSEETLFPVTLTDKTDPSCSSQGFVLVRLGERKFAEFTYEQGNLCLSDYTVEFTAAEGDYINGKWKIEVGGQIEEFTGETLTYSFPTTGYYRVTFSAETGDGCIDEFSQLVEVFDPRTDIHINAFGECTDYNQTLELDHNIDGFSAKWYLVIDDQVQEIGNGSKIDYDFVQAGSYQIQVEISNDDCTWTINETLNINNQILVLADTIDICVTGNLYLLPDYSDLYTYEWDSDLIENKNDANPFVAISEETLFPVTITSKDDINCSSEGFVLVRLGEREFAEFTYEQSNLCLSDFSVDFTAGDGGFINGKWKVEVGSQVEEFAQDSLTYIFPAPGYYRVTFTAETGDGCVDEFSQLVEVIDPRLDIHINAIGQCSDFNQTLTLDHGIEGFAAKWFLVNGEDLQEIGTGTSIEYDFGQSGIYEVQVEIGNGQCSWIINEDIAVSNEVTVLADTIDVCVTGNLFLLPDYSDQYNYEWESDLIENKNEANPFVSITTTTLFEVTITDKEDASCTSSGFVLVRVGEKPIAGFNYISDICGDPRSITFESSVDYIKSYTWYFDTNDLSQYSKLSKPTYTYPSFGSFEVMLISESYEGCIDTLRQTIEVNDFFANLDIIASGSCDGLDYSLGLNKEVMEYQVNWYLDNEGQLTSLGTGESIDYSFPNAGSYDIRVELENDDCTRSFVKRLIISDGIEAPDTTIVVCQPGLIALNPYGRNDLSYTWSPATGLDDVNSVNPVAEITSSIQYTVNVSLTSNGQVCSESGQVTVDLVNAQDTIPFDTTTITVCEGEWFFLNPDGDSTLNYYWQPESFFNDARESNPSTRLYMDQEFVVTITDPETNCSNSYIKKVIVIPYSDLLNIDYSFQCGSTVASLIALDIPTDGEIEWVYNEEVISTDPVFDYDFESFGSFDILLRLTGSQCIETSAVISLLDPNNLLFNDSIFLCEPQDIQLNPTGDPNLIYKWGGGMVDNDTLASPFAYVDQNSIFFAVITHPNDTSCTTTGRVNVFIESESDIISTEQTEFCMGDSAFLKLGNGEEAMNVQWYDPDGILIGADPEIEFVFEKMGEYSVSAQFGDCVFTDTVVLMFRNVELTASKTDGICPGEDVVLEVILGAGLAYDSIVWSPSNIMVSETDPRMAIYSPDSNTIIETRVYFSDGCLSMDTLMLKIPVGLENLEITTDKDTVIRGEKATLTPIGDEFMTYEWNPSEFIDNPMQAITTVLPPVTTEFTLNVTDDNGCSIQKSITIFVINPQCEPPFIFVPRAFTPNGDGNNDVLYVRGESIDKVEFIIYNRWGQKLFETNDQNIGWDGSYQGKALAPDVYGYYLNVECIGGDTYEEKGNVTIIR
ncbi:T9SS type B sorting domain-containing protein [Membranihabitans marinus]|uniref:T9SS type B sorting domain-containing protein n=1 Tax=Membranihabitans marinus TaxID=1227546 RepID=UPI001F2FB3AF|nr:gliding motility-associated C-terminal domain-containing protein [Membranihabitans marinus]